MRRNIWMLGLLCLVAALFIVGSVMTFVGLTGAAATPLVQIDGCDR